MASCRQISLMYDHVYKRVWLDFQINAFPNSSLSFGLDSEGAVQDARLDELERG